MATNNKALQPIEDMIRIVASGATLGLTDRLGDGRGAERTAAARERTGFAGDVANAASYLVPGVGLIKGAKLARGAVRAAPKAATAIERTLRGGGVTRAEALARAGLPRAPSVASRAVKAVTAPVRKHPIKSALAATGVGTVALSDYAGRNGAQAQQALAVPEPAAAAGMAAPRNTNNADRLADDILARLGAIEAEPSFPGMAQQLIDSQGGISLRQMGALAETAQRATPKPVKPIRPQDLLIQRLMSYNDARFEQELTEFGETEARQRWHDRALDLAKISPIDQQMRANMPDIEGLE